MSSTIPIANLYYLLSYAWSHFQEGEEIDVSAGSCPDLANLLARVLASGIQRLAKTGFERQYQAIQEDTPRLKGRVFVADSYQRMIHRSGRMKCEFDELSYDTPVNRILWNTADMMLRVSGLTPENHQALRLARNVMPRVERIRLTGSAFYRVQLHRNIRRYRLLIQVCRLIFESLLPDEQHGSHRFRDILRDEIVMHRLFEQFVRNFADRHCSGADVRAMTIRWQGEWGDDANEVLPQMLTDVTIEWPNRKVILDCKFYKEALVIRENRQRLHSAHLYQLNAYLQNKSFTPGWEEVEGILLYPAVDHQLDVRMTLLGHKMRVVSLDLDQPWDKIHSQLENVLQIGTFVVG